MLFIKKNRTCICCIFGKAYWYNPTNDFYSNWENYYVTEYNFKLEFCPECHGYYLGGLFFIVYN